MFNRFDLNYHPFQTLDKNLQTKELCIRAIDENPNNLIFVRDDLQTYDLIKFAINKDGLLLKTINLNKQTYELCLLAVKNTSFPLLCYIKSEFHTKELIEIENNIDSLEYIKNPQYLIDKKICKEIIKKKIEECIICQEIKQYYFEYECEHICCFDCKIENCYYNCSKKIKNQVYKTIPNIKKIIINTNFI